MRSMRLHSESGAAILRSIDCSVWPQFTPDPRYAKQGPCMNRKHVVIVGAGPGGLTSAMILARRGFRVTVFESKDTVGGRNAQLSTRSHKYNGIWMPSAVAGAGRGRIQSFFFLA